MVQRVIHKHAVLIYAVHPISHRKAWFLICSVEQIAQFVLALLI